MLYSLGIQDVRPHSNFEFRALHNVTGTTEGGGAALPGRMASVAGQAMNRLLSFGRASIFEGKKADESGEGTPRPVVPSALLTPNDSRYLQSYRPEHVLGLDKIARVYVIEKASASCSLWGNFHSWALA